MSTHRSREGFPVQAIERDNPPGLEAEPIWSSPRLPIVLVADGMALVLAQLRLELLDRDCATLLASDGQEALEFYQRYQAMIDLVLLDVGMPRLDGPRTLARLREINPRVRCCFMIDQAPGYSKMELSDLDPEIIFDKPFHPAQVARCLCRLLSERREQGPRARG